MYRDFVSLDPKLRLAHEYLENGNYKRALTETNKILKKTPKAPTANALKALVFLRNSKVPDACQLMESVMKDFPIDSGTLNIMHNFFKEVNRENEVLDYLKLASEKFPDNDELLLYIFFSHVRKCDFDSQQSVARKMLQKNPSNKKFLFWTVLSTIMQGEKNPILAERMFLPLAQKMLEKALNDDLFETHVDLQLYVNILKRLNKHKLALDLLKNKEIIDPLNSRDYTHDYSNEVLSLNSELGIWSEILQTAKAILLADSDDWSAWRAILQHAFISLDSGSTFESRLNETESLIQSSINDNPKQRGPLLAYLDFAANCIQRGIHHRNIDEAFCKNLLKTYFDQFGSRPICALDIAHVIPLLLPDITTRISFLEKILKETSSMALASSPSDRDATHRHVCAYRIARTNGVDLKLTDLLSAYQFHDNSLSKKIAKDLMTVDIKDSTDSSSKKNVEPNNNQGVGDMLPSDGILMLAVSELLEKDIAPNNDSLELGRMVLATHWLDCIGLQCSPANHFMRLRLAILLSSSGGLNCVDRQLRELKKLELKQILLTSLGHLAVVPGPFLTIWSHTSQPKSVLPEQPANNHLESPGQHVASIADAINLPQFFDYLTKKTKVMISESEECLVGAYRQHTYTQVREFCQFLNQLCHADAVISSRSELLYRKILLLPNSFDEVLENMGSVCQEVSATKALLEQIIDCRDFATIPEFSSRLQNLENQLETFSHLKKWAASRLNLIDLFGVCAKLIMKFVVRIEFLKSPRNPTGPQVSSDSLETLKIIQAKAECIFESSAKANTIDFSNFQLTDLLLSPIDLCKAPPPLPKTSMADFYCLGPYGETLRSYIDLLSNISSSLDRDPDLPIEAIDPTLLEDIVRPVCSMIDGCQNSQSAFLMEPPTFSNANFNAHPGAILLGIGTAVETVSLAILLISSVASMLRPRRFAHQSFSVNSKKKQKQKSIESSSDTTNESSATTHCPLACYFDDFAVKLYSRALPILEEAIEKLYSLTENWANWSLIECSKYLADCASKVAEVSLLDFTPGNLQWIPHSESAIINDMATDYHTGFLELASICSKKSSALEAIKSELHLFTTSNNIPN